MGPFVHKRKSFEHEKEVRAVVTRFPAEGELGDTITSGIPIRIDLNVLVETVYIAPDAPSWVGDLVKSVIQRYGFNFNVEASQLNQRPVF